MVEKICYSLYTLQLGHAVLSQSDEPKALVLIVRCLLKVVRKKWRSYLLIVAYVLIYNKLSPLYTGHFSSPPGNSLAPAYAATQGDN